MTVTAEGHAGHLLARRIGRTAAATYAGWLFAAVALLWGATYALIRVAVEAGLSPLFVSWARLAIGAALLLTLGVRAHVLQQLRGRLRAVGAFALVELAVPQPLIASGESRVSSSLTSILIAVSPLCVALIALRAEDDERPSRRALAGLIVGLAGVAALVGGDVGDHAHELEGVAEILGAALCYAIGPMILKRHLDDIDHRATMGASMALAALALTPTIPTGSPDTLPSLRVASVLIVLGVFCTAVVFVAYGALIGAVGARRALLVTYVNPLVALVIGIVLLGEPVGKSAATGIVLVLVGAWLANSTPRPNRSADASRSADRAGDREPRIG